MGKLNAEWHAQNPMPKHPTLEQRIAWHVAHAKHCGCRKMPASIVRALGSESSQEDGIHKEISS